MSLQKEIQERQNKPEMLMHQFAARYYFNTAEKCFTAAFILSVAALSLALFDSDDSILSTLLLIIPPMFGVCSWILIFRASRFVKNAALLRNYFDNQVLGLKDGFTPETTMRKIKQLTNRVVKKHRTEYEIQVVHTSKDNPPGVKDWYEFSKQYSDSEVIFECQRQNQYWTKKLLIMRLVFYGILFIITLTVAILLCCAFQIGFWKVVSCVFGLLGVIADSIINNTRYINITSEIDGAIKILEISNDAAQIEKFQEMLGSRREIPVLEINLIHRRNSSSISEEYNRLSK